MCPERFRLVPDLVVPDPPAEVAAECPDILLPGVHALFPVVERDFPHPAPRPAGDDLSRCFAPRFLIRRRRSVDRVAETQAEPGFNADSRQGVHHLVQPGEVVLSRNLLALHPAGLAAGELHAALREEGNGLPRIECVAVERLKADAEDGALHVNASFRREAAQQFRAWEVFQRILLQIEVVRIRPEILSRNRRHNDACCIQPFFHIFQHFPFLLHYGAK